MPDQDWQESLNLDVSRGIDLSVPPFKLKEGQFLTLRNVVVKKDEVIVDTGYRKFAGVTDGIPRATYQFFKTDGTSELTLITNSTFYKRAAGEWQLISNGVATTCVGDQFGFDTNIEVADISGFSVGDLIGIIRSDGTQMQPRITAVVPGTFPAGTLQIDNFVGGTLILDGASVVNSVKLNGTLDILVSITTMPGVNWMIFTNGIDTPQRYDGFSCEDVPNLPGGGSFSARVVRVLANYLLFMNTIEGGTAFPQRVRRSDTGNPNQWTTGNAGWDDLLDTEDFIVAAEPLGTQMIIYKERSINKMTHVGTTERTFFFEEGVVTGEGAVSTDAVVDLGDEHLLFGNSNFYLYDGGFSLRPIGDEVFDLIFSAEGELNPSFRNRSFGVFVEELDEAFFFYPSGANEVPNKIMRYQVGKRAWYDRIPANTIVGYGFYQREDSPTWNELVGTWLDQTFTWSSRLLQANSPTLQLCGDSPQQVYEYDYIVPDDDGVPIDWIVETPDFISPNHFIRTNKFYGSFRGDSILVEHSIDQGQSYGTIKTISPGSVYAKVKMGHQRVSIHHRFRLSGSGGGFGLRWYGLQYRPETES